MKNTLAVFENFKIRRIYDEKSETWFFSVVDIIQALIQQPNYQTARKYWNKLKERLKTEGSQLVTNCHQLKMTAGDGKMRLTDVANPKTQNLRDHMREAELICTASADLSTRQIAETMEAAGMEENKVAGKTGGGIAKRARLELEEKTGKKVVSGQNYLPPKNIKEIQGKNDAD